MLTAIGDVMREAYKRGWITTRDGNCSVRMKNRPFLYSTPCNTSNSSHEKLTFSDYDVDNGDHDDGRVSDDLGSDKDPDY